MTLGSKKENGKLIYQFNIEEREFNDMLKNPKNISLNLITGNKDYDVVHFELKIKRAVKSKEEKKKIVKLPKKEKFVKLAELIGQIIIETSDFAILFGFNFSKKDANFIADNIDAKLSKTIIQKTALALQKGFEAGDFEADKDGGLFNSDLIESYGGFIDKDIQRQVNTLAKKHKIQRM